MPETNVAPTPGSTPPASAPATPPAESTKKFAGKYDTPEALEQGFREIHKPLGLDEIPADQKLYGEGGMFTDITKLEQGYKSYAKLLDGRKAAPAPDAKPNTDPLQIKPSATETDAEIDVPTFLTKAGIDVAALETTFVEKGDLTPEQYAAIQKARPGMSKADIKLIADGMVAKSAMAAQAQAAIKTEAVKLAGGDQQLESLLAWAGTTLKGAELDDMNRRLGNPQLYKGAIQQLMSAHREAVGAGGSNSLITGGTANAPSVSTPEDIFALTKRAEAGDESAKRTLRSIPNSRFAQIMSTV